MTLGIGLFFDVSQSISFSSFFLCIGLKIIYCLFALSFVIYCVDFLLVVLSCTFLCGVYVYIFFSFSFYYISVSLTLSLALGRGHPVAPKKHTWVFAF